MRISNYLYPNFITGKNQKREYKGYNINFSAKTISSSYGRLSSDAQKSLENLHINLKAIQELFLQFAHYPAKAIAIKDGYSALIQKNRNQGLAFNLPNNEGSMIIRQLRSNDRLLRFIVEKDGNETHFLTEDFYKVVANINKNNPQFLPRRFKYMQPNEIRDSKIEDYIKYADEEIQKYNDYLNQYRNPEKIKELQVKKRKAKAEKIVQKTVEKNPVIKNILEEKDVKLITDIFQMAPDQLPESISATVGTKNNIIGLKLLTSDGATLKVSKKVNAQYGDTMTYLSFEKLFPDGTKSYMSVDLKSFKFLKMKDLGKPLIRNHSVYEYSEDEVIKRNMVEKFMSYTDDILKDIKPQEQNKVTKETVTEKKPREQRQSKQLHEQELPQVVSPIPEIVPEKSDFLSDNFEKLKELTINKAKEDAKTLSDLYFKTFAESFNQNIMQKLADFKTEIEKLLGMFTIK